MANNTPYTESLMSFAGTLFVREQVAGAHGRRSAPAYINNVGVAPDVPLDYMTKANLISGGKAYVNAFTKLILNQIR